MWLMSLCDICQQFYPIALAIHKFTALVSYELWLCIFSPAREGIGLMWRRQNEYNTYRNNISIKFSAWVPNHILFNYQVCNFVKRQDLCLKHLDETDCRLLPWLAGWLPDQNEEGNRMRCNPNARSSAWTPMRTHRPIANKNVLGVLDGSLFQ